MIMLPLVRFYISCHCRCRLWLQYFANLFCLHQSSFIRKICDNDDDDHRITEHC